MSEQKPDITGPNLDVKSSTFNVKRSASAAAVDAENPWLGLVSYTEETRGFFHGREEEAAELGRRVQRKLLTVLFGQSGLGKTSILQAGLVPRLRPEGFCPVYVRLDYDPHSPPPADQIKRAVFRATEAAGTWTQSGSAVSGETLWEFLHHRDDVLKDAGGRTLIPILIFDQFEEIFTLAQSDDAGRKRAQEFLADLADLVENRPPVALEARIDRDEADAAKFDFARADYRILISLREDYLAHLEGLKGQMPSVTQNRMRLARMTGAQAVAAVRAPAKHLVGEAVAEAVVRFVAGGADLARAEVEPSLLSLICRELNNTRLTAGQAEISADLLAGSRDTILTEFYARALADQPAGVRTFIEDVLLTDSGFRESVAEERVRKGFVAAGAAAEALALLVDRRLLRVEDRLDMRRVEITHDVLCSVIGASRSVRREREALEESRRQIARQKERELATHRALLRARVVAAVASVLMLLAAGSAVFGWVNLRRAQAAETEAQHARELTERARGEAEKLVGFLLEDFYEELKPTGRVEIVGKLADKAVAYYDGLPPELMTWQTKLYRGLALARKASSLSESGKLADATVVSGAARKVFEELRLTGDRTDEVATGLALTYYSMVNMGVSRLVKSDLETGVALLRPIVVSGRATRTAKLTLADLLQHLAHAQRNPADGIPLCEESRKILVEMGALDLSDLTASSIYGDVTDTQSRMAQELGRTDEAERLAGIVVENADKVLVQRPGDLRAMLNRYYSANMLGQVARARNNFATAEAHAQKSIEAAQYYTRFNPADSTGWRNLIGSHIDSAYLSLDQGRVAESLRQFRQSITLGLDSRNKTGTDPLFVSAWFQIMGIEAQAGHLAAARAAQAEGQRTSQQAIKDRNFDAQLAQIVGLNIEMSEYDILAVEGNYAKIHALGVEHRARLDQIKIENDTNRQMLEGSQRRNRSWLTETALRLGNYEEAVTTAREAVTNQLAGRSDLLTLRDIKARDQTRLGQALLGAGRRNDALVPLGEALAHYRDLQAKGTTDTSFRYNFARALYYAAKAQAGDETGVLQRQRLLDEAANLLDGLTIEARNLLFNKELIQWITEARKNV